MAFSDEVRARLEPRASEIIARYPRPRSALLPLLHLVQAEEGHVSQDGIGYCADLLGLTGTDVTSVLSYYSMYKRAPVGEYHVGVCTNTLCAIMGGDEILAALREHVGVPDNEPTPDGKVSVEHVECNAACDFAPVVMVNWEFFDNMTPDSARALVDDLRAGKAAVPSRGPSRLCTWRQAATVLAGFPDGLAGEGPQAAGPTLAGLRVANEHGWTAPDAPKAAAAKGGRPGTAAAKTSPAKTSAPKTSPAVSAPAEGRPAEAGAARSGAAKAGPAESGPGEPRPARAAGSPGKEGTK